MRRNISRLNFKLLREGMEQDILAFFADEDPRNYYVPQRTFEGLQEDLNSSLPELPMPASQVETALKGTRNGAKVHIGYITAIKLAAVYEKGKTVKKTNTTYPIVRAIKVTNMVGCTGVNYGNTALGMRQAERAAAGLIQNRAAGFTHDDPNNLGLITTSTGKKCVQVWPWTIGKPTAAYYISVDGADWTSCTKAEIAKYMSPESAAKFMSNYVETQANYQSKIRNQLGEVTSASGVTITDANGETVKLMASPINITYFDPTNPYVGIFKFNKESSVRVVADPEETPTEPEIDMPVEPEVTPEVVAEEDPLGLDFPDSDESF